jgi:hypothetical protein
VSFTIQLGAVTVVCRGCGSRYQLNGNGNLRLVDDEAYCLAPVVHEIEGPCPECAPPDGGGETVAAE